MVSALIRVLSGLWTVLAWTGLKFWVGTKAFFRWLFGIAPPQPAPKPLHRKLADNTRMRWNRMKARFTKQPADAEPELAAHSPQIVQTATAASRPRPVYEPQAPGPPEPPPAAAAKKRGFFHKLFAVPRSFAAGWRGYSGQRRARNATAA